MKQNLENVRAKLQGFCKNNQGFSIVELLTSLTIFAFFAIALFTYMTTAAKVSSSVNSSVNLGIQSQVALGLVEEYLVDCSGMVEYDATDEVLYIVNNYGYDEGPSAGDSCIVYKYRYDDTEKALYYSSITGGKREALAVDDDGNADVNGPNFVWVYTAGTTETTPELLSKNIDSFAVEFDTEPFAVTSTYEVERVTTVQITLEMSLQGSTEEYTGNTVLLLRNKPYVNELNGV